VELSYPTGAADRDNWILFRRPPRNSVDPHKPYAYFLEEERGADGKVEQVAAVFLTNRECPFRCAMCDLWRNTFTESAPVGAIPRQIDFALKQLGQAKSVKLYNSGSFFDPRAVPPEDHAAIAIRVRHFERVIVECHPAFVGRHCVAFRDLLKGRLEIAMGLETAHPEILAKLNKRMTLDDFAAAAGFLRRHEIDVRAFILVQPPFMKVEEAFHWARRSLDFAFDCAAGVATLIPTRGGNGAMEALAAVGEFAPPALNLLEDAAAYGLGLRRGRVFTDLWDVKRRAECALCFDARVERLRKMNLQQSVIGAVSCDACGGQSGG
jgi:radical SAM enzyme (TIGR01210 family)